MAKLSGKLSRIVTIVVVLVVVAGGAFYFVSSRGGTKKVTAEFASAVGVYPGTPVEILGVEVGSVTKVSPHGSSVGIEMNYDSKYKVPANAISVIVANSLVSDRYIQLAPVYSGSGAVLASGASIPMSRTASPAELDDIYAALSKLSKALGPQGANKSGSLNALLTVAAANLKGNGANLGNSIDALSKAAATLSNGRQDLFGTVRNLQSFTKALSDSDAQVRHFEQQLAQVAGDLANERADLGSALHNLTLALRDVATFVKANASKFHTDIGGLKTITGVLVKQKAALNETLAIAPVALANLVHTYQPDLGVIATRSNLSTLLDPSTICATVNYLVKNLTGKVPGLDPIAKLFGSLAPTVTSVCATAFKGQNPTGPLLGQLQDLVSQLTSGGLGGLIPIGQGG